MCLPRGKSVLVGACARGGWAQLYVPAAPNQEQGLRVCACACVRASFAHVLSFHAPSLNKDTPHSLLLTRRWKRWASCWAPLHHPSACGPPQTWQWWRGPGSWRLIWCPPCGPRLRSRCAGAVPALMSLSLACFVAARSKRAFLLSHMWEEAGSEHARNAVHLMLTTRACTYTQGVPRKALPPEGRACRLDVRREVSAHPMH